MFKALTGMPVDDGQALGGMSGFGSANWKRGEVVVYAPRRGRLLSLSRHSTPPGYERDRTRAAAPLGGKRGSPRTTSPRPAWERTTIAVRRPAGEF